MMTFLPEQIGKFIGQNVIMVLTFFFFEPQRGSRGLPLAFLDCFMHCFHFRFSVVTTFKPSLGLFFWYKEKNLLSPTSQNHFQHQYDFSPKPCSPQRLVHVKKKTYFEVAVVEVGAAGVGVPRVGVPVEPFLQFRM